MANVRAKLPLLRTILQRSRAMKLIKLIEAITDWNVYFNDTKSNLEKELVKLKGAIHDEGFN